ncbi:sigma 54-interacting transcriptional regulator [Clostridium algidicarnis]|uniref:Transcriptional regulatory protein LevR n=1 Tax=Clostridium algidicarnis DSM 15099 TaxID=1121295 RepID=A0A2S6FYI5_9CLOT|nr:sigma-54-dependent transcriptional regulator [Clostridium algidicarnis]PPK48627.1 transcriptional regulatory protein LevR [Clostridium algidicarnis DSM 15099]
MKIDIVYNTLSAQCTKQLREQGKVTGVSTEYLSKLLDMKRANVARELGKLINEGTISKGEGRPVLYYVNNNSKGDKAQNENLKQKPSVFDSIIGKNFSLKHPIALAKAAIVYPPKGLHTLIVGETGVGKSFFAKCMFKYSLEVNNINNNGSFAVLNCADYANNPQLLLSHLFGVEKGAYTGATENKDGIIERARDGILFLDEVHRLPSEGQEMLFTLIDEGKYTPLGSTREVTINTMIICATTENIESSLLKTFKRRIPVTITLPSLRERTAEERASLIENFFEEESKRIGKKIDVETDAFTALLNYECPNNIGELKGNIQIGCAKAFLRTMFTEEKMEITIDDFSEEVRAGLLLSKKISSKDLKLKINNDAEFDDEYMEDKYSLSKDLYEFIDKETESLKKRGLKEDEIKNKISNEVEGFINNYLSSINNNSSEDDIKRIVNNELYDFLSNFMYLAEYKLKRNISKNIFLGLLLHIDTFIGRIRENRLIANPKIDKIRKRYPEEFKIAMMLSEKLEQKYDFTVPMDEIGFITMFFAADIEKVEGRVTVIVAMHGKCTATSMAEVTNQLLNENHAIGFDMPLSMKPEVALNKIENIIKENHEGVGAILLVDMGSLKFFDKIIKSNTGIDVKAVDMVTTATVIEATRKALMHQSLDEIVKSVDLESRYVGNFIGKSIDSKKEVIITACSTGEGTAQKLKEIIYSKYSKDKYEVINLSIKDKEKFKKAVGNIRKDSNIISIISAFDLKIEGIHYIPMDKFFKEFMGEDFEEHIKDEKLIKDIKNVYKDYLDLQKADYIVNSFMELLTTMKYLFGIHLDSEKLNGLLMHFGCLIQLLINREEREGCNNLELILSRHQEIFKYLQDGLQDLEETLKIKFTEDDLANIVEILIKL